MAETFWCGGEAVKFSNAAVELLLAHWLALAEARAVQPGMTEVAAYLLHRLRAVGDGGRAFGMDRDRFPAELAAPAPAAALAELVAGTAADAGRVEGVLWDSALRAQWEDRLRRLHVALAAWQPAGPVPES